MDINNSVVILEILKLFLSKFCIVDFGMLNIGGFILFWILFGGNCLNFIYLILIFIIFVLFEMLMVLNFWIDSL